MTTLHSILGYSHEQRPIELHCPCQGAVDLLLIAGVHGDEPEGFGLAERFLDSYLWKGLAGKASLWLIPRMNPDGCAQAQRWNARGVDLNRNMPTQDWSPAARSPRYTPGPCAGSEIETRKLMDAIDRIRPRAIFSLHSQRDPCVNYNGPCHTLAQVMAVCNGYPITDDIGYPTPGSLGTWAGGERQIPTVTLEIKRGCSEEQVWMDHRIAVLTGLEYAAAHQNLS